VRRALNLLARPLGTIVGVDANATWKSFARSLWIHHKFIALCSLETSNQERTVGSEIGTTLDDRKSATETGRETLNENVGTTGWTYHNCRREWVKLAEKLDICGPRHTSLQRLLEGLLSPDSFETIVRPYVDPSEDLQDR